MALKVLETSSILLLFTRPNPVSCRQCKCIFKENFYLVELREAVKILIDVALDYLKKRVRSLETKQAKKSEQDSQDKDTETEDDNWTDDETMKIFLSIVKVLQINFPLYKVHKIYAAVSDLVTGALISIFIHQ